MESIVFASDMFRIHKNDSPFFDGGLLTIHELFSEQITLATKIRPEVNLANDKKYFDKDKFLKLCNLDCSIESWEKFSMGQISDAAKEYFIDSFKDCFLIFYHGSPQIIKLLDKSNIPYIDLQNSSHKFLEDLFFHMKTNNPGIFNKMLKYKMPDTNLYFNAARVKASYLGSLLNRAKYHENSLLICGQTDKDVSLAKDGKFVCFDDFDDEIKRLMKNYSHVYYKKHPYAARNDKNLLYIKKYPKIDIINENFYSLMANPAITGVCALSSGVLEEAEYFRKNVHVLSHKFFEYNKDSLTPDISKYTLMNDDYFSPTFWADILSPCFKTYKVEYFNFKPRENFIRKNVISHWWGYELGRDRETISRLNGLDSWIKKHTSSSYKIRKFFSIFIPAKSLRRKFRGDE